MAKAPRSDGAEGVGTPGEVPGVFNPVVSVYAGIRDTKGGGTPMRVLDLSLINISEPTRQAEISYAGFCLKKKRHITKPKAEHLYQYFYRNYLLTQNDSHNNNLN